MGNKLSSFSGWLNTCVKLVNYYVNKKYTLPYTGSMVLDVNQVHIHDLPSLAKQENQKKK